MLSTKGKGDEEMGEERLYRLYDRVILLRNLVMSLELDLFLVFAGGIAIVHYWSKAAELYPVILVGLPLGGIIPILKDRFWRKPWAQRKGELERFSQADRTRGESYVLRAVFALLTATLMLLFVRPIVQEYQNQTLLLNFYLLILSTLSSTVSQGYLDFLRSHRKI